MTTTARRGPREEQLYFCGLDGQYLKRMVQCEPWTPGQGWQPATRLVHTVDDARPLLQKAVPVELGQLAPHVYDQLENEIRCGVRLAERYRRWYPPELFRLVGYNFDAETPYLLLEPPRGVPVGEFAGKLLLEEQQAFVVSLLRGLQLVGAAGIVHGGLQPAAVRWDGSRVQLLDFGRGTMAGEARSDAGTAPWAAPEQRSPGGSAAPSDDVWSAGLIIHHALTGRQVTDPPELDARGGLRRLLDGVFDAPPQDRPTVADLLQRSRAKTAGPVGDPPAREGFEAGRAEFDLVRDRKQQPPPGTGEAPPEPERSRRRAWGLAWSVAGLVLAVAGLAAYFIVNKP